MFNKPYEERLSLWREFRASLEVSKTPIEDAIAFYNQAQPSRLNVDPWEQSTWPDPWELLKENVYCEFNRVLGVCYSLQLCDCFKGSKFEIHICTDNNLGYVYLLQVDNKIIGWDDANVVDKDDLPKDLKSQLSYPMPNLQ
jgi:hypothetical protein